MKRSVDRILTKPVGSLHRPEHLTAMMMAKQRGELVDQTARLLVMHSVREG